MECCIALRTTVDRDTEKQRCWRERKEGKVCESENHCHCLVVPRKTPTRVHEMKILLLKDKQDGEECVCERKRERAQKITTQKETKKKEKRTLKENKKLQL